MTFHESVAAMTMEEARWVRAMRIDEGRTWRWVADEWSNHVAVSDPSWDFASGQFVCERAATLLGEDPSRAPWN